MPLWLEHISTGFTFSRDYIKKMLPISQFRQKECDSLTAHCNFWVYWVNVWMKLDYNGHNLDHKLPVIFASTSYNFESRKKNKSWVK